MQTRVMMKTIMNMNKGDKIYINAINGSLKSLEVLMRYIQRGELKPDEQEVRKMINGEEVIEDVMNGRRLCPQMTYIKQ